MSCSLCPTTTTSTTTPDNLFFLPSLCHHSFHEACLKRWVGERREKTGRYEFARCPDCRSSSRSSSSSSSKSISNSLDPDDCDFLVPAYRMLDFWIPAPAPSPPTSLIKKDHHHHRVVLEEVFPHEGIPELEAVRRRAVLDLYDDDLRNINERREQQLGLHLRTTLIPRPERDSVLQVVLEEVEEDHHQTSSSSSSSSSVQTTFSRPIETLPRIVDCNDREVAKRNLKFRRERIKKYRRHLREEKKKKRRRRPAPAAQQQQQQQAEESLLLLLSSYDTELELLL